MKLHSIKEAKEFMKICENAKGYVWAEDMSGTVYDLNDEITRYVVVGTLLKNEDNDLEIFANLAEDETALLSFIHKICDLHTAA